MPVVVSGRSTAADTVERYELGAVFTPGDQGSFIDAVLRVPPELPAEVIARAQAELSHSAVARRLLALALEPTNMPTPELGAHPVS